MPITVIMRSQWTSPGCAVCITGLSIAASQITAIRVIRGGSGEHPLLTAKLPDSGIVWAAIDEDALCSAPAVADRRFSAYLAPHKTEASARAALIDAGCSPDSIAEEKRARRHRGR